MIDLEAVRNRYNGKAFGKWMDLRFEVVDSLSERERKVHGVKGMGNLPRVPSGEPSGVPFGVPSGEYRSVKRPIIYLQSGKAVEDAWRALKWQIEAVYQR